MLPLHSAGEKYCSGGAGGANVTAARAPLVPLPRGGWIAVAFQHPRPLQRGVLAQAAVCIHAAEGVKSTAARPGSRSPSCEATVKQAR